MDWKTLEPDEYALVPVHYTPGRAGRRIDKVVIHHNGSNLSIPGIRDVWLKREASAHYQVDINGRIGQIVHDWDTAWHSANQEINRTSIGIEHANNSTDPYAVSQKTLENGAHLTAAVCRAYGLGAPGWRKNVFPHWDFTSTSCPGSLGNGGSQFDEYVRQAKYWYDNIDSGAPIIPEPSRDWRVVDFPPYPFNPYGWQRFGIITGPYNLHGGDPQYDGPEIQHAIWSIQWWLCNNGFVPDVDNHNRWCDGFYEQETVDAVKRFQEACMPGTTYPGEVWADDYQFMVDHNPM